MKKAKCLQLLLIAIVIILFWLLTSCKSKTVYVPVQSVKTEYRDKVIRDSIFQKELVRIYQRGDTVFKDSIVYEYKNKFVKDTVNVTDTIRVPYPVKGDTEYLSQVKWSHEASVRFTLLVLVALALYVGIKYRSIIFSFLKKLIFKI